KTVDILRSRDIEKHAARNDRRVVATNTPAATSKMRPVGPLVPKATVTPEMIEAAHMGADVRVHRDRGARVGMALTLWGVRKPNVVLGIVERDPGGHAHR